MKICSLILSNVNQKAKVIENETPKFRIFVSKNDPDVLKSSHFIRFFHSGHLSYLVLLILFIMEDKLAQDITIQIKGSCRFHNSTHLYIN